MNIPSEKIIQEYMAKNSKSAQLYERAQNSLEGGITRTSTYFQPFPIYMERGDRCMLYDVDGNERIDFLGNYTSMIHGYNHPKITETVIRQIQKGSCFGAPTEQEVRLAEVIISRVESIERLRFASSGSEAVMFSLRLAQGFTGRHRIAKIEGGFHGSYDYALMSMNPPLDRVGSVESPTVIPDAVGISPAIAEQMVILPFNDIESTERLISRNKDELACVLIEPIIGAGGVIPARKEYLQFLREITQQYRILLIFDEIISFRVHLGGAQALYGIRPDLTTLGKIISGGYPVAAFGGREDIMALMDPRGGVPKIPHSGTFNGTPVGMVAGLAAMELLTPEAIDRINQMGDQLRTMITETLKKRGVKAQVTGVGSLFNIHFSEEEILDYRAVQRGDMKSRSKLFFSLLNRGIFLASRGMGCISTAMTGKHLEQFNASLNDALVEDLGY
jgi:glutamate-1-semialdehyde 2,1-aminomutase